MLGSTTQAPTKVIHSDPVLLAACQMISRSTTSHGKSCSAASRDRASLRSTSRCCTPRSGNSLHPELPFASARMLRDLLRAEGFAVERKHMNMLMRRTGHHGAVPQAEHAQEVSNSYNTRRPHSSHKARTPDVMYFASLPQPSAEAA